MATVRVKVHSQVSTMATVRVKIHSQVRAMATVRVKVHRKSSEGHGNSYDKGP